MSNIAIVTDSDSGISQMQADVLKHVYVVPMPFMIQGQEYFEDINLTVPEFFRLMGEDCEIITSQPSPDSVMSLWDRLLKEYEAIVYLPMSSSLSGSCQTAMMLAEEYAGRVQVVDNQRISVTLRQSVLDAVALSKAGYPADQIKKLLEEDALNSSIYIMLDTLYYLKKGGRITPAAAALGSILRIKPVLQIQGGKLDAFAKARTSSQGKSLMLNALHSDLEKRFGGASDYNYKLFIAHTQNEAAAFALKNELALKYPEAEIYMDHLPLSISCHIGPGAIGVGCCRKFSV